MGRPALVADGAGKSRDWSGASRPSAEIHSFIDRPSGHHEEIRPRDTEKPEPGFQTRRLRRCRLSCSTGTKQAKEMATTSNRWAQREPARRKKLGISQAATANSATNSIVAIKTPPTIGIADEDLFVMVSVRAHRRAACGRPVHNQAETVVAEDSSCNDSEKGALAMPRSVTIAATYLCGVTSKAGFSTRTPSGATCLPA